MQAQATKRVHEANELPEEIEDFKDWLSDQEGESYSEDDIADWGWDYVKDRVEYPNGVKTHYTTYTTKYRGSKYTCEVAWDNFNEVIQGSEVWQGDPESRKTAESVNLLNKAKTATEAQAGVSPYLIDIAHKILVAEYGWGAATREEVSSWLAEHKKAFERGYGQSLRMYDDDKINVRAGIDAILNEEEGAVTAAEIKRELEDRTGLPSGEGLTVTDVENLLQELNCGIVRIKGPDIDWSFRDEYSGILDTKSESLKKNFRFKDPKSEDDLIAIQDIVYEINRRNESQAVAEKIGSELESLMESASRDPKWNEMSDEECASAMYKAAQPILSKITSEQLEEIFRNPGHDHDYFQDAIEYDEEAEEPEYRADDLYDFSSIRHESKCEWLDPEGEAVLKKQAPKLIDALNAEFKRIGSPARLELASDEVHFSDGYYLPVKCSGKWDEESRMLNARLERNKTLNGVKYYDGNIYLEKGWRPASFRGARWLALHEKLEKMGSPKHEKADEIVFEPVVNFKPQQYAVYEIDDDGDELECIFSGTSGSAKKKLGDAMGSDPSKKFHVVAIAYTPRGQLADSEVVWSDLKQELAPATNEAASRVVADNKLGKIVKARQRDNTLAFYPLDDDGKDDDCIYFFKLDGNDIVTKGYQWGRDGIDRGMIAEDGYPWTVEPGRPTRDYVHTKKYAKYLLDRVRKCLDLGIANGKTEATSDGDLLARLKAADPEKAKYIIRAFHDSEGYWVWFPDEVSTYEPYTHTLHEYSVAELLRAYKRSKIVGAKGESYERATKEIQVRKNGQPWTRYAVTWPEYVDTYTKEAKERGWDEVRVIDLGGKGKHEALFNAKTLEDYAINGIKSAIMAAWSGAGVKNFKLDIQRNDYNLDVYSNTLDGVPTGTSWRVLPMEDSIVRYADNLTNGSTEVVADIPYITDDDVERIFTDEFKKLDDDMSESYVSKEGNWGASNPDGFRKLDDLLEAAGFQCTFDNRFGDELVARDGEKFYVIEYNVPPDMVVDRNKPWEIFNGDSGEFMKNFIDPETAAAYLTAKKGKE